MDRLEGPFGLLEVLLRDDHHEADAHVEHAVHLLVVDLALVLDELEDRRNFPCRTVNLGVHALREDARDVVRETAASNVRHAVDLDLPVHQLGDGLEEALVHGEERVAERLVRPRKLVLPGILAEIEDHAARERKAVRLQAVRRETEDHVSSADRLAGDELRLGDAADDRADEIVLARRIETRHFGGLTAEERHLVLLARLAEAGDNRLELLGVDLRGADVVHEEKRRGALHEDVVHAVVDDVLSDRVVLVHHRRHLQLRADAIGRGDENHVLALRDLVETPERADVADDVRRLRRGDHLLDGAHSPHLHVNVNAGCGICGLLLLNHDSLPLKWWTAWKTKRGRVFAPPFGDLRACCWNQAPCRSCACRAPSSRHAPASGTGAGRSGPGSPRSACGSPPSSPGASRCRC